MVYIKEAHPDDEWAMAFNEDERVRYAQPESTDERRSIASDFVDRTGMAMPIAVDGIDNAAMEAYAAWPERLYVITADGRIGFKGGMGPFFFSPDRLEAWLDEHLE